MSSLPDWPPAGPDHYAAEMIIEMITCPLMWIVFGLGGLSFGLLTLGFSAMTPAISLGIIACSSIAIIAGAYFTRKTIRMINEEDR